MTDYGGFIKVPPVEGYHEDMTLQEMMDLIVEQDRRNLEAKLRRLGMGTA